jgi:hypothetical protein
MANFTTSMQGNSYRSIPYRRHWEKTGGGAENCPPEACPSGCSFGVPQRAIFIREWGGLPCHRGEPDRSPQVRARTESVSATGLISFRCSPRCLESPGLSRFPCDTTESRLHRTHWRPPLPLHCRRNRPPWCGSPTALPARRLFPRKAINRWLGRTRRD